MRKASWRQGIPLEEDLQQRLRKLLSERGERGAAEFLELGVPAVVRAAAGLGLRRGTAFVIKAKLEGKAA